MSFSAPRNVNHRSHGDGTWGSSGQNGYTRSNISSKLDGYFDKRELPMYKDKPYSYASSRRKSHLQKWRFTSVLLLLLIGLLYWLGMFSSTRTATKLKHKDSNKSTWSWLGRPAASKVDWDDRREKVKEAFVLSWDGYEKYAWGKLTPNSRLLVSV